MRFKARGVKREFLALIKGYLNEGLTFLHFVLPNLGKVLNISKKYMDVHASIKINNFDGGGWIYVTNCSLCIDLLFICRLYKEINVSLKFEETNNTITLCISTVTRKYNCI
jgi:hypothetical protein